MHRLPVGVLVLIMMSAAGVEGQTLDQVLPSTPILMAVPRVDDHVTSGELLAHMQQWTDDYASWKAWQARWRNTPERVRQLRREAQQRGLDPNVWFGNVERIASERIGRETCTYVSNIYKYYVAYRLMAAERDRKKAAATGGGH